MQSTTRETGFIYKYACRISTGKIKTSNKIKITGRMRSNDLHIVDERSITRLIYGNTAAKNNILHKYQLGELYEKYMLSFGIQLCNNAALSSKVDGNPSSKCT